jgi:hypothetical protein
MATQLSRSRTDARRNDLERVNRVDGSPGLSKLSVVADGRVGLRTALSECRRATRT